MNDIEKYDEWYKFQEKMKGRIPHVYKTLFAAMPDKYFLGFDEFDMKRLGVDSFDEIKFVGRKVHLKHTEYRYGERDTEYCGIEVSYLFLMGDELIAEVEKETAYESRKAEVLAKRKQRSSNRAERFMKSKIEANEREQLARLLAKYGA